MNLEEQVTNLNLAIDLEEIVIDQSSLYYQSYNFVPNNWFSAFTAMAKMLLANHQEKT